MKPLTKLESCPQYQECLKLIREKYGTDICCIACNQYANHQLGYTDPDAPSFLSWKD